MSQPQVAPFGTWKSPITTDLIVAESIRLGAAALAGDDTYWAEGRPAEGGRNVVVRRTPDGQTQAVTPAGFNVRTTVHEYGGGAYLVADNAVYFANFADQRIYRQRLVADSWTTPEPVTPDNSLRYADFVLDRQRNRLIAICEDHSHSQTPNDAVNTLVAIPLDGVGDVITLVTGNDFYSSPRLSPDGTRLAWLTWNHPNMPWDGTELWTGDFTPEGTLTQQARVAGGPDESIFQPEWSPTGILYFVSDQSGWWNLYRGEGGRYQPLHPLEAEFGAPQWGFGMSTYGFTSPTRIICAYTQDGKWQLTEIDVTSSNLTPLATPYESISGVRVATNRVVFNAGSPTTAPALVQLDLATRQSTVLKTANNVAVDAAYFSVAQPIEFPTANEVTAHAFFYPPRNPDFATPQGEKPPLLVMSHGGPTAAASSTLDLETQYWTSRGIAVLDVNYGGSTGYGTAYRRRLNGQWGIVDVVDCINGAQFLVQQGLVDGDRLMITGGSAGGYTTLCALTFHDVFKAGASHFGISDQIALLDSHKFESRYNDTMLGPYPERKDLYIERSPIHFADQLSVPVIFFQGLEDKVVPPDQSEKMVDALRAKGVPVAYLTFPGEQHGFRKAENIKRAIDGEFYFYSRVFGFTPADAITPVAIENMAG